MKDSTFSLKMDWLDQDAFDSDVESLNLNGSNIGNDVDVLSQVKVIDESWQKAFFNFKELKVNFKKTIIAYNNELKEKSILEENILEQKNIHSKQQKRIELLANHLQERTLQVNTLGTQTFEKQKLIDELNQANAKINQDLNNLNLKIRNLQLENDQLKNESANLKAKDINNTVKQKANLNKIDGLEVSIIKLEEEIAQYVDFYETKVKKLTENLNSLNSHYNLLKKENNQYQTLLNKLQKQSEEEKSLRDELSTNLTIEVSLRKNHESFIEKLQKEKAELNREIREVNNERFDLYKKNEIALLSIDELKTDKMSAAKKIETLLKSQHALDEEKQELQMTCRELKQSITNEKEANLQAQGNIDLLHKKLSFFEEQLQDSKSEFISASALNQKNLQVLESKNNDLVAELQQSKQDRAELNRQLELKSINEENLLNQLNEKHKMIERLDNESINLKNNIAQLILVQQSDKQMIFNFLQFIERIIIENNSLITKKDQFYAKQLSDTTNTMQERMERLVSWVYLSNNNSANQKPLDADSKAIRDWLNQLFFESK